MVVVDVDDSSSSITVCLGDMVNDGVEGEHNILAVNVMISFVTTHTIYIYKGRVSVDI